MLIDMWLKEDDELYNSIKNSCENIYDVIPYEKLKESPYKYGRTISNNELNKILFANELLDLSSFRKDNITTYNFINNKKSYKVSFNNILYTTQFITDSYAYKVELYINNGNITNTYIENLTIKQYHYLITILNVIITDFIEKNRTNILIFNYDYHKKIFNKFISDLVNEAIDDYSEHIQLYNKTNNTYGKIFFISK